MPIFETVAERTYTPTRPAVAVRPSLAVEMFWTIWMLGRGRVPAVPGLDLASPAARALAGRINDLWPGAACLPELLVLADASGGLFSVDGPSLVEGIVAAAAVPPEPERLPLRTESPEDRAAILRHLEELSSDVALRRRLEWVLRDLWALIRPAWEAGRPKVEGAAARLSGELGEGADPLDLLPTMRADWRDQVSAGLEGGGGVIVPALISGAALMLDLPGGFLAGAPLTPTDPARLLRSAAEAAVRPLKALADPTRLAILGFLNRRPSGMAEIAQRFGLSQPTVSVHFRTLREAGLVRGDREAGRVVYGVDEERLEAVLAAAARIARGDQD